MSLRLKGQRTHNQGDKSCWILSHCTLGYQDHGNDFLKTHWAKTSRYKFWIWKLLLKNQHISERSKKRRKNRYKDKQNKGKQEEENERGLLQCELYGGADYVLHNYSHILAERGLYLCICFVFVYVFVFEFMFFFF